MQILCVFNRIKLLGLRGGRSREAAFSQGPSVLGGGHGRLAQHPVVDDELDGPITAVEPPEDAVAAVSPPGGGYDADGPAAAVEQPRLPQPEGGPGGRPLPSLDRKSVV